VFQRFEKRLEGMVTGAFARIFRSAVQPVEIAAALQRELDNSAQILSRNASLVPNDFSIALSPSDYDRLAPYSQTLSKELSEVVSRHAGTQSYAFTGPVTVSFERADNLSTGRFKVRSSAVAQVTPARRVGTNSERRMPPRDRQPMPPTPSPQAPPQRQQQPQPQPQPPLGPPPGAPIGPPMGQPPSPYARPPEDDRTRAMRPPAPPAVPPYLDVNGLQHVLEPPGIVLGRGTDADLRITDPGVSRRHAEVRVQLRDGQYVVSIHDLGSTNGIVVNGQRTEQAMLEDGSQVLLGNTLLVLRRPGAPGGQGPGPGPEVRR
jgi:pSer/pThr/pTyr-binding forkhead associated (FHA) protein